MLFGGGLIAVLGSESIGYGGAGPLGCITAAFVSCYFWSKQGWEIEDVSKRGTYKRINSFEFKMYLHILQTRNSAVFF